MGDEAIKYVSVKKIEKYHPGYKDRELKWAKIYFDIVQGDPAFELIESEVDKWRFVAMICLQLQAQAPLPDVERYWISKGFDTKMRPMSLTLQVLHNFVEVVTQESILCTLDKEKNKRETPLQSCVTEKTVPPPKEEKKAYGEFKRVLLTDEEYGKLEKRLGEAELRYWIGKLDRYKDLNEKRFLKYKSHYSVICNWSDDKKKQALAPAAGQPARPKVRYE